MGLSSGSSCLDEQATLDFVRHKLDESGVTRVRDHLDGCPVCRQLVAEVARGITESASARVRVDRVGRYVLGRPIGEGAMGIVYHAYDPELDRAVALKLLRPETDDAVLRGDGRARMQREA